MTLCSHFCLSQKERDLELAARIGQSLLKKNKTLTERNELLEEQVEHIREEVRADAKAVPQVWSEAVTSQGPPRQAPHQGHAQVLFQSGRPDTESHLSAAPSVHSVSFGECGPGRPGASSFRRPTVSCPTAGLGPATVPVLQECRSSRRLTQARST